MSQDLPDLPEGDPQLLLSESARIRIHNALVEGTKNRRVAEVNFRHGDLESQLALDAASFAFAFSVLSVMLREFKGEGIHGEQLREVMAEEIEGAVNSLELGAAQKRYLEGLFNHEWGW